MLTAFWQLRRSEHRQRGWASVAERDSIGPSVVRCVLQKPGGKVGPRTLRQRSVFSFTLPKAMIRTYGCV
jgi:hypothetical protein